MSNEHSDGSVGRGNDIDNPQSCVWETRDNEDARSVASNASSRHSVSAMERRVRMAALVEERKFSAGQAELERYQAELERSLDWSYRDPKSSCKDSGNNSSWTRR